MECPLHNRTLLEAITQVISEHLTGSIQGSRRHHGGVTGSHGLMSIKSTGRDFQGFLRSVDSGS